MTFLPHFNVNVSSPDIFPDPAQENKRIRIQNTDAYLELVNVKKYACTVRWSLYHPPGQRSKHHAGVDPGGVEGGPCNKNLSKQVLLPEINQIQREPGRLSINHNKTL